jgi:class III poly(R)-hydroxyalkanoic acid synthase PhaC subunit
MNLFQETTQWMQEQMQLQSKFVQLALHQPEPPTWTTPNEVVLELPALRLRKFHHELAKDSDIPVLIITPQVNHSYICDYAEGQSLVATLQAQGLHSIYCTEWRSAEYERASESLDDALGYINDCVDHMGGRVSLIGLCQGGWMSMIQSALHPNKVENLVLAAAPIDFHEHPGGVNLMARTYPMAFYRSLVEMGGGVMRGDLISMGFNNMRFYERNIGKYMHLYANIDNDSYCDRFKRLQNWYALPQNIPGKAYLRIVEDLFKHNKMVKGELKIDGRTVDLSQVTCPVYMIAGSRDHITRPGQLFAAEKYVSSEQKHKYTADAGHIGVFMGGVALRTVWPKVADQMLTVTAKNRSLAGNIPVVTTASDEEQTFNA